MKKDRDHLRYARDVRRTIPVKFLKDVDEIWHAGDIGSLDVADRIAAFKQDYPPCAPSAATSTARDPAGLSPFLSFECEGFGC